MALPAKIDAAETIRWPSYVQQPVVHIRADLRRYFFARDVSTDHLEAWASDDGESWEEVGAGSKPQMCTSCPRPSFAVARRPEADTIWLAYTAAGADPYPVNLVSFTLSTETFGTPVTGGPEAVDTDVNGNASGLHIVELSDGRLRLIYGVIDSSVHRTRAAVYDPGGAGWTSDVDIGDGALDDTHPAGLLTGASDRTHLFFWELAGGSTIKIWQRTWDSSDTFQTLQEVISPTSPLIVTQSGWGLPLSYADGGDTVLIFPYLVAGHGSPDVRLYAITALSVDDPAWTTSQVNASIFFNTASGNQHFISPVAVGSTAYLFSSDIISTYYWTFTKAGGWSAAEIFWFTQLRTENISATLVKPTPLTFGMTFFSLLFSTGCFYNELVIAPYLRQGVRRYYSGH